jgi:hypothetical protein
VVNCFNATFLPPDLVETSTLGSSPGTGPRVIYSAVDEEQERVRRRPCIKGDKPMTQRELDSRRRRRRRQT